MQRPAGAWELFSRSQESVRGAEPEAVVTQPAHAALAGQLAAALRDEFFGPLPPEVVAVIGAHDAGWAAVDLRALERAAGDRTTRAMALRSFLALAPVEAIPAWRASVRLAEAASHLAGALTSRHFCLLAGDDDPAHRAFVQEETERRERRGMPAGYSASEVDRFTAALGFCDLLSLYLASGLCEPASFPLAHAADPASERAEHTTLLPGDDAEPGGAIPCRFDRAVFQPATEVSAVAWCATDAGYAASAVRWQFR